MQVDGFCLQRRQSIRRSLPPIVDLRHNPKVDIGGTQPRSLYVLNQCPYALFLRFHLLVDPALEALDARVLDVRLGVEQPLCLFDGVVSKLRQVSETNRHPIEAAAAGARTHLPVGWYDHPPV